MAAFWTTYGIYLWLLTAVGLVVVVGVTVRLASRLKAAEQRYTTLVAGTDASALEDIWLARAAQVQDHAQRLEIAERTLADLRHSSVRHIGLIRYNPFDDVGSDQSFALALLDGDQKGVVISSIYSRTGGRIYAKPIQPGAQARMVSEEEEMAIAIAVGAPRDQLSVEHA